MFLHPLFYLWAVSNSHSLLLRFLSYNHVATYIFLFLLVFALRAPSFHPQYFETDESYYLVAAEKIVDGGIQYIDTWDNKPPMLVWVYSFFVFIFGSYALLAIRIFTCLYIYISALFLNQMVVDNRLINRFSLFPAFLLIFLTAIPWYTQELNGEVLMALPVILAVMELLKLKERDRKNNSHLFLVGVLLGLAFMVKYQAILLFLGLSAAYLSTQTPRLTETFSFVSGFLLTTVGTVLVIYFTGALEAFWDIGVLYNLDYIRIGRNPGEVLTPWFNLGQYGLLWGVFILSGLAGLVHYRANYFTNSIRLRKVETIVLYWFIASLATIVLGGGRLYLHYFYLLVPPLAIYVAKVVELKTRRWLRNVAMLAAFVIPAFTYGVFLISAFPQQFQFIDPYLNEGGWVHQFRERLNELHPLEAQINTQEVRNGILVLKYEPTIYTRLDLPCATKYTNFSMANFKMEVLPDHESAGLVSKAERKSDIYQAFQSDLPEYIVDPLDLFPYLQESLPLLLKDYEGISVSDESRYYKIYRRKFIPAGS